MPYRETVKRTRGDRVALKEGTKIQSVFDGATVDAFERLRVSEPYTVLGLKQLYDGNPLFYDDQQVSGSGTLSTFNDDRASTIISVSANTVGNRLIQSKARGVYQTGKGFLFLGTAVNTHSVAGITKRIGYYDEKNGLFFQHKNGVASVVRRTFVTGAFADTIVAQSAWNVDKMDGTGPSGITLDFTKSNIFVIDFEWLGVGRVRMGFNVDGKTVVCHQFLNANNLDAVYMSNPNLPIRYEIENSGSGAAASLECVCAAIISEGGQEDIAKSTYISRSGVPITLANQDLYTPVISVRLKDGHASTKANIIDVNAFATTTTNYEWKLLLNPNVSGSDAASWVGIDNSSIEYDVSRDNTNTVSGGYQIAGGYGSSTAQSRAAVNSAVRSFLTLGTYIGGTSDQLVLATANIDANGGTMYGGLTIGEYF